MSEIDRAELRRLLVGACDWGNCGRWADSLRFDERLGVLVPVCWRHIAAYRIGKGGTGLWQAEDEFAGLRFCRRARWRWLAQRRILADQRAAMAGRVSRAQMRRVRGRLALPDDPSARRGWDR